MTITQKGRGAWPADGRGGTLSADGTKPGRYYTVRTTPGPAVGSTGTLGPEHIDDFAVMEGVNAIRALLFRARYTAFGSPLALTGAYDASLAWAVKTFQERVGLVADGVFGPKTSERFFLPTVKAAYGQHGLDWKLGFGLVATESAWDPGAVGYVDDRDLGLCQINGSAHPDMDMLERLDPESSLMWQANYMRYLADALPQLRDAIAAYNLGLGGARMWIAAGRPDLWTPPYDSSGRARDVAGYINKILGAPAAAGY